MLIPLNEVFVESFAVSQPESSWDNLCAYLGEVLVQYHRLIEHVIPIAVEFASRAAENFYNFIQLSFEQQTPSHLCLLPLVYPFVEPAMKAFPEASTAIPLPSSSGPMVVAADPPLRRVE